jgi:hypothetical protein
MDCLVHMSSRKSKWTECILFECPECEITVRTVGNDEE